MLFRPDITAFSDLRREHPPTDAHVAGMSAADRVVICSVIRGDIRSGIERRPQSQR